MSKKRSCCKIFAEAAVFNRSTTEGKRGGSRCRVVPDGVLDFFVGGLFADKKCRPPPEWLGGDGAQIGGLERFAGVFKP